MGQPTNTFTVTAPDGKVLLSYTPTPKQAEFHASTKPNCIIEGSRGTGKSLCIRMDAHMRALMIPGFSYLIVRRTMPELKKSHLRYINQEMAAFGGKFHNTDAIATYANGSQGFFSHCETEDDMMKLLSSEYSAVYFDEISTFTWSMITKIASCVRVVENSGILSIVRGGTNPIGIGAEEIRRHYITKDIDLEEDPDYNPDDFQAIHTTLDDNPFIDREQYIKTLKKLPEHLRRAWLDGEWVIEGAYFHDYKPQRGGHDWHVIQEMPLITSTRRDLMTWDRPFPWLQWYRAIDWGFSPDPAVCLWIAVLPNGRAIVHREKHWRNTTAAQVAKDILAASDGKKIVDSYCDPTMFYGSAATDHVSIGDIFEDNGVWLTQSINDRTAAGYAIHEWLNTTLDDGLPRLQISSSGCPMLARTLGEMRTHSSHPERIADSPNDHWCIALAYFCLGRSGTSREPLTANTPFWMRPKRKPRVKRGIYA